MATKTISIDFDEYLELIEAAERNASPRGGGALAPIQAKPAPWISDTSGFPDPIALNVGGVEFVTNLSTLRANSGLFEYRLSTVWNWTPSADGSYFLDTDPQLFAHLLRFMRRPQVFPLFYTNSAGFDYDLYNKLEIEAGYFQINALRDWIKDKLYLHCVMSREIKTQAHDLNAMVPSRHSANVTEDRYYISRTRQIYLCPKGIFSHRGCPWKCTQHCIKFRGDEQDRYEDEEYHEVVSTLKELQFIDTVCRAE